MVYNCFLINVSASAKSLINFYSSHSFLANTANSRYSLKLISLWLMTLAPLFSIRYMRTMSPSIVLG